MILFFILKWAKAHSNSIFFFFLLAKQSHQVPPKRLVERTTRKDSCGNRGSFKYCLSYLGPIYNENEDNQFVLLFL